MRDLKVYLFLAFIVALEMAAILFAAPLVMVA